MRILRIVLAVLFGMAMASAQVASPPSGTQSNTPAPTAGQANAISATIPPANGTSNRSKKTAGVVHRHQNTVTASHPYGAGFNGAVSTAGLSGTIAASRTTQAVTTPGTVGDVTSWAPQPAETPRADQIRPEPMRRIQDCSPDCILALFGVHC